MSKIGRKPIDVSGIEVSVTGHDVHYKGKKGSGVHKLPDGFEVKVEDGKLRIVLAANASKTRDNNILWGMHRANLANEIAGATNPFEKQVVINGLGFKAALQGKKVEFTLGYSHKLHLDIPEGVTIEIDKTGQLLTVRSPNKELLGAVCDRIRSFRPPEPYKGTGIKLATETIIRKAGKAKAAA